MLSEVLKTEADSLTVTFLHEQKEVADDTYKLLVSDSNNKSLAVVIVSSLTDEQQVEAAMRKSADVKQILGKSLGQVILEPLVYGNWQNLSWAALPYHQPYGENKVAKIVQRFTLRPNILVWLKGVSKQTISVPNANSIEDGFRKPLMHFYQLPNIDKNILASVQQSLNRLENGYWQPRHVLMHGDLWKGNILHAQQSKDRKKDDFKFVVIDWAGSLKNGYPMFDLIRLAQSVGLHGHKLNNEIDSHCKIFNCEPIDAISYLLAALGWISMNLGFFPYERFCEMANSCYMTMSDCINDSTLDFKDL